MNPVAADGAPEAHHLSMINGPKRSSARSAWASCPGFLLATLILACHTAAAATTVEVLATEPTQRALTLASGQTFYMRIGYTTDTPVRIWARPYFEGREVNAGSNPSRMYAGEGEALAWFFFLGDAGQQVDEIRISAGDGTNAGTEVLQSFPVRITGGTRTAADAPEPEWLTRLKSEDERLQREDYEQRMSEPLGPGGGLFAAGFMLAVLAIGIGGVALAIRNMRRWEGSWRLVAALPALWVGFVVLRIVLGTSLDPTSHNLWPFEIVQASVVSLVLTALIALAKRWQR